MNNERHPAMTEITIGDPVPGLTLYTITCREARELPGPQQDIEQLRQVFWLPVVDDPPNALAGLVRRHRRGMGMTQAELSERIGAHRAYIGCLENGAFVRAVEYILPLSKALNIPPTELLEAGAQAIAQQREANHAQAA